MESLLQLYASSFSDERGDPDGRLRYLATPRRANDGGHSPRALGLDLAAGDEPGSWTVLSGADNYYAPIFVSPCSLRKYNAEPYSLRRLAHRLARLSSRWSRCLATQRRPRQV